MNSKYKIGTLFFINGTVLLILSYFAAYFYHNSTWQAGSYIIIFLLIFISNLVSRFDPIRLLYNSICLIPCINYYIPLGPLSLTLPEIFLAIFVLKYLSTYTILKSTLGSYYFAFTLCCIVSILGSAVGVSIIGLFIRFGFIFFTSYILMRNSFSKEEHRYLLFAFYTIPFTAASAYLGEDMLIDLFTTNLFSFQRIIYSFQYPVWVALVLPILFRNRFYNIVICLVALIVLCFIVLSFSRSIYIGAFVSLFLFLLYFNFKKKNYIFLKLLIATILSTSIYILFVIFNNDTRLSFTSTESESNEVRFRKFDTAFKYIEMHPFFGNGFGIQYAFDIAEQKSTTAQTNDLISPEFGPLTLLSEVGIFGSIFFYLILLFFFKSAIKVLKNRIILMEDKVLTLISILCVTSTFLNSNSYISIILLLFIPIPKIIFSIYFPDAKPLVKQS